MSDIGLHCDIQKKVDVAANSSAVDNECVSSVPSINVLYIRRFLMNFSFVKFLMIFFIAMQSRDVQIWKF